eukprot:m51a1_g8004 putative glyoxylate reductase (409) ;mRNA; r:157828-159946
MARVFVTRAMPEAAMAKYRSEPLIGELRLREAVCWCDCLVSQLNDRLDAELLAAGAAARLRLVAQYAAGVDNVDLAAAARHGVAVSNTPGVLTETVADLAWALLLASARRIVEADALTRAGNFKGWAPTLLMGTDVHHKTLGVVGMGRIGRAVARRARGFDMRVLYATPRRLDEALERELSAAHVPLGELLREADYVVLATPGGPATRHLVGAEQLRAMKRTAHLVNVGRGTVVDEAALAQALREGVIAGAALDVYEREPEVDAGLRALSNCTIVAHIGSSSVETRTVMGELTLRNVVAHLSGKPLVTPARVRSAQHGQHGPSPSAPVVDEAALAQALREGVIAGAALDVYEREPEVDAGLRALSNCTIVAHIGSSSVETRTVMGELTLRNVVAHLSGKPLVTPVKLP